MLHDQLLLAIDTDDVQTASELLTMHIDLNVPCAELDGAPPLFLAILKGNAAMVQLLLENGANPNYLANEPVATVYCAKPLDLARQARVLMDWDKYHAVVEVLETFGATGEDDRVDSRDEEETSKARVTQQYGRVRSW